jgi:hypothetical protein
MSIVRCADMLKAVIQDDHVRLKLPECGKRGLVTVSSDHDRHSREPVCDQDRFVAVPDGIVLYGLSV